MEQPQEQAQPAKQGELPKLSAKKEKELEGYSSGIINMIYDKQTSGEVYELLKSAPPEQSIPQATLLLNERMEGAASSKGKKPSLDILLNTAILVIEELITVGHAGGFFQLTQEETPAILEATLQTYIEKGLADGTMDPIELQAAIEPLMTDEMKQEGLAAGQASGVSPEAGVEQAMETYANKRVGQAKSKFAEKEAGQNRQGAMAKVQQAAQQGGK